jgi:hypothetical protein
MTLEDIEQEYMKDNLTAFEAIELAYQSGIVLGREEIMASGVRPGAYKEHIRSQIIHECLEIINNSKNLDEAKERITSKQN